MASEIDIYNMALAHIGNSSTVQDEAERSPERIACSRFYETTRDALLAYKACPWGFAKTTQALADLGDPPTNWLYRYAVPNDCITALFIVIDGNPNPREDQQIPFEIAFSSASRVLLTNQPQAVLCYVKRITEAERLSSPFVEALAVRLGAMIATPLAKSTAIRNDLLQLSEQFAQIAMAHELNQAQQAPEPDSTYIAEIHA